MFVFIGVYLYDGVYWIYLYFVVVDFVGVCCLDNVVYDFVDNGIVNNDFDLNFWYEIY